MWGLGITGLCQLCKLFDKGSIPLSSTTLTASTQDKRVLITSLTEGLKHSRRYDFYHESDGGVQGRLDLFSLKG